MAAVDLLSDQGFRNDGRKPGEIRKFFARLGVFDQADGSAYVELGHTRVLAAVYGPHEVRQGQSGGGGGARGAAAGGQADGSGKAVINCQFSMATFSTSERKLRPRGDYRSLEITANLQEIFEAAILTENYPNSQIDIFVEVLQADGANYSACINAASLAVIHAGIPVKDIVCSCTAGLIRETPITDVSYVEETMGRGPLFTLAILPKTKQILSMESTGRIHVEMLDQVMEAAIKGCEQVLKPMQSAIMAHLNDLST